MPPHWMARSSVFLATSSTALALTGLAAPKGLDLALVGAPEEAALLHRGEDRDARA